jgi:hypothetical protein
MLLQRNSDDIHIHRQKQGQGQGQGLMGNAMGSDTLLLHERFMLSSIGRDLHRWGISVLLSTSSLLIETFAALHLEDATL